MWLSVLFRAKPKDASVAPFSIQLRNHFRHFPYLGGYSGVSVAML